MVFLKLYWKIHLKKINSIKKFHFNNKYSINKIQLKAHVS